MLIEVVVAVLMAALLLVPLATGVSAAVAAADRAEEQARRAGSIQAADAAASGWVWGQTVAALSWEAGPVLHVTTRRCADTNLMVGLWADGWFVGEWSVGAGGERSLEAGIWSDLPGRELVARVREVGQAWGPPWRTAVPDVYGRLPEARAQAQPTALDGETLPESTIVAHMPGLATAVPEASWTDRPAGLPAPLGLPFFVGPAPAGACGLFAEGAGQIWLSQERRYLDVYF